MDGSDQLFRLFLALFFSGVAGFYTIRIITKSRAEKVKQIHPGKPMTSTWIGHLSFRVFRAAIWLVCLFRVPFPEVDRFLGVFPFLMIFWLQLLGVIMLLGGFMLALVGHSTLGIQWRSGIDPNGPKALMTCGIYGRSRNPMFLGVKAAQLGFFLALPSVFSLICLIVGWIAVDFQLRAEEKHLASKFPTDYSSYSQRVPRWL